MFCHQNQDSISTPQTRAIVTVFFPVEWLLVAAVQDIAAQRFLAAGTFFLVRQPLRATQGKKNSHNTTRFVAGYRVLGFVTRQAQCSPDFYCLVSKQTSRSLHIGLRWRKTAFDGAKQPVEKSLLAQTEAYVACRSAIVVQDRRARCGITKSVINSA